MVPTAPTPTARITAQIPKIQKSSGTAVEGGGGANALRKVDATEGNTTTEGMGSVDDLLGLVSTGFKPPSTPVPSSVFGKFSTFDSLWSQNSFV